MDLIDSMNELRHNLRVNTGEEPTAFILGAKRFLEFKLHVDALRTYPPKGVQEYEYSGIPILVTEIDPGYIGITVPPSLAINRYGLQQLENQHPNGKSGAW